MTQMKSGASVHALKSAVVWSIAGNRVEMEDAVADIDVRDLEAASRALEAVLVALDRERVAHVSTMVGGATSR